MVHIVASSCEAHVGAYDGPGLRHEVVDMTPAALGYVTAQPVIQAPASG